MKVIHGCGKAYIRREVMACFRKNTTQSVFGHGDQAVALPVPVDSLVFDGISDGMFRDMKNRNSTVRVIDNAKINIQVQSFYKTRPCSFRLLESLGAHNTSGTLVCYSKNNFSAAFVGQCRAIFDKFFKVVSILGFLEFEALSLFGSHYSF